MSRPIQPTSFAGSNDARRLTIEQMQQIARDRGGQCLSTVYVNVDTKLLWECDKGHQWMAISSSVKRGSWCRLCAFSRSRRSLHDLQEHARKFGGTLLSLRNDNGDSKLTWQCAVGHVWYTTSSNVKQGNWCKQCYYNSMRSNLEAMQQIAAEKGGACLSTTYVDAHERLQWQCAVGHTWLAAPSGIRRSWCPHCGFDRKRLGIKKMQAVAAERSGRCLSETYVNSTTRLTWQCDRGHVWQAKPMHILRGHWCIECHRIRMAIQSDNARTRRKERYAAPCVL